ncbi:response regulator [Rhodovastum atsumiense]|uniref:response regulator n=1 Tax=Rhodovastum atsumiense TaxID=504468 RepID=UPI00139F2B8F|nr:response regulator [Rhodovastum atsumiense]
MHSAEASLVLVVSDDAALRRSLALLLRASGLATQDFASSTAVLKSLVATPAARRRCCLLVDHHLPGGTDGLRLLQDLAAVAVTVPVVLLADWASLELRRRAGAAGAAAVLQKPLLQDSIVQAISDALAGAG